MKMFETFMECKYGPLNPKVNLSPDFFSGFQPEKRKEILVEEEKFYRELTAPFSVDSGINTEFFTVPARDNFKIRVKKYTPKHATHPSPVMVFFHGGGFITCSVETHNFVPAYVARNAGITVFSVEYRLAPENKFPTGLEDCYSVIKWIAQNNIPLQIDPRRISVCGDSSGGNFAMVISIMARDRKEFEIHNQVLIYPVTDLTDSIYKKSVEVYGKSKLNTDEKKGVDFISAYLKDGQDRTNPYVSPLFISDTSGIPPTLFIQAECDVFLDDGLMLAKRLQDGGVKVTCEIFEGMPHAFILRTYDETFQALQTICTYLQNS